MSEVSMNENAVLADQDLQAALKSINPKWGDFVTRVAGEAWGFQHIDQKTKAFLVIAVDVVNSNVAGLGSPFEAHIDMALKQGATKEEIEEVLVFMSVYAGFNKAASALGRFQEIVEKGQTALGTKI